MNDKANNARFGYLLLSNLLVLGIVGYAAILQAHFPDLYYLSVQEDEYIEWASFWAFLLASGACLVAAHRYRHVSVRLPWFHCGVALFCFLVAMEEISWGQRVLGYRPPTYFLAHNFQQELNIHNHSAFGQGRREFVLSSIITAYGMVLPLLGVLAPARSLLERLGVIAPSVGLLPAFGGILLLYNVYPWSHTGEWVELMLGIAFLCSALPACQEPSKDGFPRRESSLRLAGLTAAAWVGVLTLGLVSSAASRVQRDSHPATMQAAHSEIEALKRDFESGRIAMRCGRHNRAYTFVKRYRQDHLLRGEFASLQARGLPEERADFLLDPWNSPYWIVDWCFGPDRRRVAFVYSFGPDRRRDSTKLEIRGDDIGAHIALRGPTGSAASRSPRPADQPASRANSPRIQKPANW